MCSYVYTNCTEYIDVQYIENYSVECKEINQNVNNGSFINAIAFIHKSINFCIICKKLIISFWNVHIFYFKEIKICLLIFKSISTTHILFKSIFRKKKLNWSPQGLEFCMQVSTGKCQVLLLYKIVYKLTVCILLLSIFYPSQINLCHSYVLTWLLLQ